MHFLTQYVRAVITLLFNTINTYQVMVYLLNTATPWSHYASLGEARDYRGERTLVLYPGAGI